MIVPGDEASGLCLAHGGDVSQPSGGTDRVTALAAGLQEDGFDVSLVVPEPDAALPPRLDGVDVYPVETSRLGVSNALTRAETVASIGRRVARERSAMLQLEHSTLAGIGTLRGCDGYVLDIHDIGFARFDHVDSPAAPALKRGLAWLERRAVDRAAHVVAVSEYMYRTLREEWGVADDRVTVVPNGYFPERIEGCGDGETVPGRVCFLGTLHPKVDVETLEMIARSPAVSELVIVGDGAQRDRVDELTTEVDPVRATGRLPDAEAFELVARARVLVNPQTDSELQRSSSPVKLYYYAALGKAMVVTEGPSVVDELVSARAAKGVSSRRSFVGAVEELLDSPDLRRELARNARRLAKEFTWDERTSELAAMYRELEEDRVLER
jgi:glycosyltransferase involved in cell wall biosynthesis